MSRKMMVCLMCFALLGAAMAEAGVKTSNQFFYKPSLGARGTAEMSQFDAGLDLVDAHLGKYKTLGDPGYETLAAALSTIGSTPVSLVIPAGTVNITANTTIPANVHLVVQRGGIFNIANGVTLTINGPLTAGLYQIFALTGTGKASFADGTVKEVYPQWWGAKGDGTTDCAAAFQAAINGLGFTGTVHIPTGEYVLNSGLTLYKGIVLRGDRPRMRFGNLSSGSAITVTGGKSGGPLGLNTGVYLAMENLRLVADGTYTAGNYKAGVHGVYITNQEMTFRNLEICGFDQAVKMTNGAYCINFHDSSFRFNNYGIYIDCTETVPRIFFSGCAISNNNYGIYNKLGVTTLSNCNFDYNLRGHVAGNETRVSGFIAATLNFISTHFENLSSYSPPQTYYRINNSNGDMVLINCQLTDDVSAYPVINNNSGILDLENCHFRMPEGKYLINGGLVRVKNSFYQDTTENRARFSRQHSGIYNNGFETGDLTGWTMDVGSQGVVINTDKYDGSYCLRLTRTSSTAGTEVVSQRNPIPAGANELNLSVFYKNTQNEISWNDIKFYNASGNEVGSASLSLLGNVTNWTKAKGNYLVPVGAVSFTVRFKVTSAWNGTYLFIDEVYAHWK
ncbi:MAG: glycosyl hydrolase family 28-related protein [Desulfobaccales bacterium]